MIIICPNNIKKKYLKDSKLHDYKFYDLNTIKEKIYFKIDDLALYETIKKYKVKPAIALKMLDSLYYIDKNYEEPKLNKLFELKTYLEDNNLLIYDPCFLKTLSDEIIIEGYYYDLELEKIINILKQHTKVTYKAPERKYELKEIYEFADIEAEVRFVAEQILELLSKKVDINKIHIVNYNNDYIVIAERVFSLFKIPFNLNKNNSLTQFKITKEFLKMISTSTLKVKELEPILKELSLKYKDDEKLNLIIKVLNKYYKVEESIADLYDILYFELKQLSIKKEKYLNVVNFDKNLEIYGDDEYVFALSNNEGLNPIICKDNDYLKDDLKHILGISTSYDQNQVLEQEFLNKLSNIKNLILTYKLKCADNKFIVSSILENLTVKKYQFKNNALNYNKYLYEKLKPYNNEYKEIEFEDLKVYLDNKLNLSYSSMDQFFRCQFRFFLNNILRIEPSEETMATKIGSMFHKILERTLKANYQDYEKIIDEETANFLSSNIKEKFYGQKLKKEVLKIIERLKEREKISDFKNAFFEQFLILEKNSKLNIKVLGFVDKILLFNDGINNYVIVIDYKTGTVSTDLTKIKDGFNMQLLTYLYLIKNTNKIPNAKLAGAYIEHILDELKNAEAGKTYEEIEKSNNRLEGLTIKDKQIIEHIDNNYEINSFIKGIKVKNDGEFYNYSKVYTEEEFDILLKYIDENIDKVITAIEICDFKINPKRYITAKPSDIIGCEFCPFKEICYVNAKDIVILNETTMEEILGDENELD